MVFNQRSSGTGIKGNGEVRMKVTKTITKTYEIYDYIKWSMTAEDTIQKRKKVGLKTKGFDALKPVVEKVVNVFLKFTDWCSKNKVFICIEFNIL